MANKARTHHIFADDVCDPERNICKQREMRRINIKAARKNDGSCELNEDTSPS
jgi:hypothetical protein